MHIYCFAQAQIRRSLPPDATAFGRCRYWLADYSNARQMPISNEAASLEWYGLIMFLLSVKYHGQYAASLFLYVVITTLFQFITILDFISIITPDIFIADSSGRDILPAAMPHDGMTENASASARRSYIPSRDILRASYIAHCRADGRIDFCAHFLRFRRARRIFILIFFYCRRRHITFAPLFFCHFIW